VEFLQYRLKLSSSLIRITAPEATLQKLRKTDAEQRNTSLNVSSTDGIASLMQETTEATDINTFERFLDKERETRMDLFMD